jgi:hypothetical protein
MSVGLIDNFGKNLMIDTWGYNKNGEIPYLLYKEDEKSYRAVWKYNGIWNEEEEYYEGEDTFTYGLMDINNPIETEEGYTYNVYASDKNYSFKGELVE